MKQYLINNIPDIKNITKIRGEASLRSFFRFDQTGSPSQIAMVFPQDSRNEINRILELTELYKKNEINVPIISRTIGERIIILEDLGKASFQQVYRKSNIIKKKELLKNTVLIISKLHNISLNKTKQVLDAERLKKEMTFFLKYYIQNDISGIKKEKLKTSLYSLVDSISNKKIFSHRDFHSRNMHIYKGKIYLIDFQDSLQGPYYYDIISFSFDSYLDLGPLKPFFFSLIKEQNIQIDEEQLNLTALQRNIKALGTYGYQINIRKNLSYRKYINRGLSHIRNNPEGKLISQLIENE